MYSTYSSFLVINVCNQGKTLCSPCRVCLGMSCKYSDLNPREECFRKKLNIAASKLFVVGVFVKLRRATVSFIMSVRPSFLSSFRMEQFVSRWTDVSEILLWAVLFKSVEIIYLRLQSDRNVEHCTSYVTFRGPCIVI